MKLALLGPEKRTYSELRLLKECRQVFDTVSYFPIQKVAVEFNEEQSLLYRGKDILDYDCVLPRIPRSYLNFGLTLLYILKQSGMKMPIAPESVLHTHNKFLTLIVLAKHGIKIPATYLSLKRAPLELVLENIRYPVVLKTVYGCKGKGVMFAESKESAVSIMDMLESFSQPVFVEEYIKNPGEDIRALVVGNRVVASMKRKARSGERRANLGVGGRGEKYEISEEEAGLAVRAAKALQMGIAGVDILSSGKSSYVIEVNVYPGLKGIESATGINVAREIANYMLELCEI